MQNSYNYENFRQEEDEDDDDDDDKINIMERA